MANDDADIALPPTINDIAIRASIAALPPRVSEPVSILVAGLRKRRAYRTAQIAQAITDDVGGEARLAERLTGDPEAESLLIEGLEVAARTGYQAKRVVLGRVIAQALRDTAAVDEAQLRVLALRDLEAPHIRALARICAAEDGADVPDKGKAASSAGRLEPTPVLATLIRTGSVHPATVLDGGTVVYRVTDFGRDLLDDLGQAEAELTAVTDKAPPQD